MPLVNKFGRYITAAIISFCVLIGLISGVVFVWSVGPAIEREWFPVVGKLEILAANEIEPGVVEIEARFRKVRDCQYLSVQWNVGNPNADARQVRVQTIVDPQALNEIASPSRPLGTTIAGPWRIAMTLDDLRDNSFAILKHQCHPFWVTTTQFYP